MRACVSGILIKLETVVPSAVIYPALAALSRTGTALHSNPSHHMCYHPASTLQFVGACMPYHCLLPRCM